MISKPSGKILDRLPSKDQAFVDGLFSPGNISVKRQKFLSFWKRIGGTIGGKTSGGSHFQLVVPGSCASVGTFSLNTYFGKPLSYLRAAAYLAGARPRKTSS